MEGSIAKILSTPYRSARAGDSPAIARVINEYKKYRGIDITVDQGTTINKNDLEKAILAFDDAIQKTTNYNQSALIEKFKQNPISAKKLTEYYTQGLRGDALLDALVADLPAENPVPPPPPPPLRQVPPPPLRQVPPPPPPRIEAEPALTAPEEPQQASPKSAAYADQINKLFSSGAKEVYTGDYYIRWNSANRKYEIYDIHDTLTDKTLTDIYDEEKSEGENVDLNKKILDRVSTLNVQGKYINLYQLKTISATATDETLAVTQTEVDNFNLERREARLTNAIDKHNKLPAEASAADKLEYIKAVEQAKQELETVLTNDNRETYQAQLASAQVIIDKRAELEKTTSTQIQDSRIQLVIDCLNGKCPVGASDPNTYLKANLSDSAVRLAVAKKLPPNQRIISFTVDAKKHPNASPPGARYILIEKSNNTWEIKTPGFEKCSVTIDSDGIIFHGEVYNYDAALVLDHQWEFFSALGLNGDGYQIYQRLWEDGQLTRGEALAEASNLGFSELAYNFFSAAGLIGTLGDKAITTDDLEAVMQEQIEYVLKGFPDEKHDYVIQAFVTCGKKEGEKFVPTDSVAAAKKVAGDRKEDIPSEEVLGLVDSGSKDTATKVLQQITGTAQGAAIRPITLDQLITFITVMSFLKQLEAGEFSRTKAPLVDYKVTTGKVKNLYDLTDADNVLKFLKGEKVGETKGKDGEKEAEEGSELDQRTAKAYKDIKKEPMQRQQMNPDTNKKEMKTVQTYAVVQGKDKKKVVDEFIAILDEYIKEGKEDSHEKAMQILLVLSELKVSGSNIDKGSQEKLSKAGEKILQTAFGKYVDTGEERYLYQYQDILSTLTQLSENDDKAKTIIDSLNKQITLLEARIAKDNTDKKAKQQLLEIYTKKLALLQEKIKPDASQTLKAAAKPLMKKVENLGLGLLASSPSTESINPIDAELIETLNNSENAPIHQALNLVAILYFTIGEKDEGNASLAQLLSKYNKDQKEQLFGRLYQSSLTEDMTVGGAIDLLNAALSIMKNLKVDKITINGDGEKSMEVAKVKDKKDKKSKPGIEDLIRVLEKQKDKSAKANLKKEVGDDDAEKTSSKDKSGSTKKSEEKKDDSKSSSPDNKVKAAASKLKSAGFEDCKKYLNSFDEPLDDTEKDRLRAAVNSNNLLEEENKVALNKIITSK